MNSNPKCFWSYWVMNIHSSMLVSQTLGNVLLLQLLDMRNKNPCYKSKNFLHWDSKIEFDIVRIKISISFLPSNFSISFIDAFKKKTLWPKKIMKKMFIFFSNGEIPTYNLLLWNPKTHPLVFMVTIFVVFCLPFVCVQLCLCLFSMELVFSLH